MCDISMGALIARRATAINAAIAATAYLTVTPRSDATLAARTEWSLICTACIAEMKRLNRIIINITIITEQHLARANGWGSAGQCPAGIVAAKTPVVRGAGKPRRGRLHNESPSPVKPAPAPGRCHMRATHDTAPGDLRTGKL